MAELAVHVRSLRHVYQDQTEVRAEGIPFQVEAGELVALIGATGTGKTTLFRHILGLLKPDEGEVRVLGRDPYADFAALRHQVSAVFQNPDEQIVGPTVYDDIALALRARRMDKREIEQRVLDVAERLGIEHLLTKIPHFLSGGQKQKVALAGALVVEPTLLILDEPFSGLDGRARCQLIGWLRNLNREQGTTVVFSTHDLDLVPELAERVYVLHHGHLVLCGTPAEVLSEAEALRAVELEPPCLVRLFAGLPLSVCKPPVSVREGRRILEKALLEPR
ncbi:MAG: energy-coupling factor ABC transporter ATP-binding protein [Bacillota bacterium]